MYHPPDQDEMAKLKPRPTAGADFAHARPRLLGGRRSPARGGDIGWVAHGQLDDRLTQAIFAAPVGKTTDVVNVPSDGLYLSR